jgi:streptomycin 6-kinase
VAPFSIPAALIESCRRNGHEDWLDGLPQQIAELTSHWSLAVGEPFQPGGQTAWVAPARSADFGDVVLKVGWRHMEAEDEAAGLREWHGEGAVLVFAGERLSDTTSALLLERCRPGITLAQRRAEEQDVVIAELLQRLWRVPSDEHRFRPLQEMCDHWADGFERRRAQERSDGIDFGIAREGVALFRTLPSSAPSERLLCTDLHADNVLAAEREPWLVIDPKPFVGDPTYDALQHHLNCQDRLVADPEALAARMADLLGLDLERLLLWLFAYCVVQSIDFPWMLGVAEQIRP